MKKIQNRVTFTISEDDVKKKAAVEEYYGTALSTLIRKPVKDLINTEHDKLPECKKVKI